MADESIGLRYKCVHCSADTASLYRRFSKEIIRLTPCERCGRPVDQYVEYDGVLVAIHLVLLYTQAYRHVVHNTVDVNRHRLAVLFILCMAFDRWQRKERSGSESILDLESRFYECLFLSLLEMSLFLLFSFLFSKLNGCSTFDTNLHVKSSILGYFGHVAIVITIVYGLRESLYYRIITISFLFLSQLQIHRVCYPTHSITSSILSVFLMKSLSLFIPLLFT